VPGRPVPTAVLVVVALALSAAGWLGASPLLRVHQPSVPVVDANGLSTGVREQPLPLDALDFVTVLVVGLDGGARHAAHPPGRTPDFGHIPLADIRGRAGEVLLLGLDRRTGEARVLHIPSDTVVSLPGRGEERIARVTVFFSFFELKRTVENLLRVPVHRHVLLASGGLDRLRELAAGYRSAGIIETLRVYAASSDLLKTNISPTEAVSLWREWGNCRPEEIEHLRLPRGPEPRCRRPDPVGVVRTVDEFWPDTPTGWVDAGSFRTDRPAPAGGALPDPLVLVDILGLNRGQQWCRLYAPYLHQGSASSVRPLPPVLIYHTHTCESFMPELIPDEKARLDRDRGREAFSADPELSVVRVGRELGGALTGFGFHVRHIETVHDPGGPDGRAGAYDRSRESVAAALAGIRGPVLVIDIHRDAVTAHAVLGGGRAAAVLFVVARQNPWWQWNYTVARNLEMRISTVAPELSRGICLLEGRYNEDLSPLALLVEIGGADSTMEECLRTARILAGVLADYFTGP